jgi:hypothetical protein
LQWVKFLLSFVSECETAPFDHPAMKMNRSLRTLLPAILLLLVCQLTMAQSEGDGSYCNVHYIQSDDPELLPFSDECFVVDEYCIQNPKKMRTLGPIGGGIDLFDRFDWAMNFYLPDVEESDRLHAVTPRDFLSKDQEFKKGEFFLTLSDNRNATRFDAISDNVDFIAVGGHARVTAFRAQEAGMKYPEYDLQIDVRMQKVDRSGDYPRLSGDPIRLRMVLVVEALE